MSYARKRRQKARRAAAKAQADRILSVQSPDELRAFIRELRPDLPDVQVEEAAAALHDFQNKWAGISRETWSANDTTR